MKILIIEDDQNKAYQIVDFLKKQLLNADIIEKQSYQSGLKEILHNKFELIILDMSLPIFDIFPEERNNTPEAYAGRDILRQMHRHRVNYPVVVVSQFEMFGDSSSSTSLQVISNELSRKYKNYFGHVYYNAAIDDWKINLQNLMNNVWERNS